MLLRCNIVTRELVSINKTTLEETYAKKISLGSFLIPMFFRGMLIMEDINQEENLETPFSTNIDPYQHESYFKKMLASD